MTVRPAVRSAPPTGISMALRIAATLGIVGLIVYLASERMYWDHSPAWFTSHLHDNVIGALFYAFGVAGALWLLGRGPVSFHRVILAGAVFAWTIEGIVVYVIHEAGPFDPLFPAMFVGWHGMVSFVGFFYLLRRFGLAGDLRALALLGGGLGVVFGLWAATAVLPDGGATVADGLASGAPSVAAFGGYSTLLTCLLVCGHIVLGYVWPDSWRPGRRSGIAIAVVTVAYAALGFAVIPWGPVRLLVLLSVPVAGLVVTTRKDDGAPFFPAMAGRVRVGSLVGLATMPVVATTTYALATTAGAPSAVGETAQWSLVAVQVLVGGAVFMWAAVTAFRGQAARREVSAAGIAP